MKRCALVFGLLACVSVGPRAALAGVFTAEAHRYLATPVQRNVVHSQAWITFPAVLVGTQFESTLEVSCTYRYHGLLHRWHRERIAFREVANPHVRIVLTVRVPRRRGRCRADAWAIDAGYALEQVNPGLRARIFYKPRRVGGRAAGGVSGGRKAAAAPPLPSEVQ